MLVLLVNKNNGACYVLLMNSGSNDRQIQVPEEFLPFDYINEDFGMISEFHLTPF